MSVSTRPRARNASAETSILDSPDAARSALENAALIRAEAAAARQDAVALVQAAREALAVAERRARLLGWIADEAEPFAVEFETRARVVNHVRTFREKLPGVEAALEALETEHAALSARADELEARLSGLAGERTELASRLTQARAAGKVAEVTALRPQLSALEEVAGDLGVQLQTARARMNQIGLPDWGQQLDQVQQEVDRLRRQHAEGVNALGPDTRNQGVQDAVGRFLRYAADCEGDAEKTRYAEILAVLDGEPGFTAIMRGAREGRAAIERRNRGEQSA